MHVLVNALSATSGGGWTYLVNVLEELEEDPRGFDFTFLVRSDAIPRLPASRFPIIGVRYRNAVQRVLYEQTWLPWIARRFDLLYCVADIAPVMKTRPTVVALRNLNIYDRRFYDNLRLKAFEIGARIGLRRVSRTLFPSSAAGHAITRILGRDPEQIVVVPHGIRAARFHESVPGSTASVRYVLIPAAVERHKNLDVIIDALAADAEGDWQAWVAGGTATDPPYAQSLRERAEAFGVAERFRLLGSVAYDDMPELLGRAFAMVLPSLLETFGHPLLEAMAAGVPIVVSDIPVFREIAADSGWFFDPTSAEALARTLTSLANAPDERDHRVAIGRDRSESFSWSASVDRLCEVFREVLADSP